MKQCNKCGASNTDQAQFCCNCGASLAPKFCPQCGTPIAEGSAFCPKCGYSIKSETTNNSNRFANKEVPQTPKVKGSNDALRICFKEKFASFEGRATRAEFWWFKLGQFVFGFIVVGIGAFIGWIAFEKYHNVDFYALIGALIGAGIVNLVFFIPSISVSVRRLHDIGKSGGFWFINLIPYGGFIFLVFMLLGSEKRDNEYGTYIQ